MISSKLDGEKKKKEKRKKGEDKPILVLSLQLLVTFTPFSQLVLFMQGVESTVFYPWPNPKPTWSVFATPYPISSLTVHVPRHILGCTRVRE